MSGGIRVSARLMKALQDGIRIAVALIEDLPPGQTTFEPYAVLTKGEETSLSLFMSDAQADLVEQARQTIRGKSGDIDLYTLTHYVYQLDPDGNRIDAVMLEVGEQGGAGNITFVQPFRRESDGKVIMLTEGPLMQGLGPSILLP